MRLRKPCEHDRYDAHRAVPYVEADPLGNCPGGEFLPEDALVWWCEEHRSERFPDTNLCHFAFRHRLVFGCQITPMQLIPTDVLSVLEGEG